MCGEVLEYDDIDAFGHTAIERIEVAFSAPTYSGNGNNNRGSTTVTLTFELSDGSTQSEDIEFTDVNYNDAGSRSKTEIFEVGCYEVTVKVELSITGNNNNQMAITGAAAEITDSVIICDE